MSAGPDYAQCHDPLEMMGFGPVMDTSRRRAIGILLPLLVASLLATTACDPAEAGSAAVVGDDRITERFVNDTATEALAALGPEAAQVDGAVLNRQIVQTAIYSRLIDLVAVREDVEVTAADAQALLELATEQTGPEELERQLAQSGVPPSQIDSIARRLALQQELLASFSDDQGEAEGLFDAAIAEVSDEVGVTVSPRYGEWDPADSQVVDLTSGLLTTSAS